MISKRTPGMVGTVLLEREPERMIGRRGETFVKKSFGNRISDHVSSKMNSKKGFTLVELIVVLVILAIIAAVAIPAMLGFTDSAREKKYIEEGKAALTATQTMLSDAFTDNATFLSKDVRERARLNAEAPEQSRFIIWTAKSFAEADGTYKTMPSYTIKTAIYETEDGQYVYYNEKGEWIVYAGENAEKGSEIADLPGDNNKIYVWPLVAGDEEIGKDSAGTITVSETDIDTPDPEKTDVNEEEVTEEPHITTETHYITVTLKAGSGIVFKNGTDESTELNADYDMTNRRWVTFVNNTSVTDTSGASYSCISEPRYEMDTLVWHDSNEEIIEDISRSGSSDMYKYFRNVERTHGTAILTVSATEQCIDVPVIFEPYESDSLVVSVKGTSNNKIYAHYGMISEKVIGYSSKKKFKKGSSDVSISKIGIEVSPAAEKVENAKFYDDLCLDPGEGLGRWAMTTLTSGNYYSNNGQSYVNTAGVSEWIETFISNYITENGIDDIRHIKATELADGGITLKACANIYKKIYIRPAKDEEGKGCDITFGDDDSSEVVVDVCQIEKTDEKNIVSGYDTASPSYTQITSTENYSLFTNSMKGSATAFYGIKINRNTSPKLREWFMEDCEYNGNEIDSASSQWTDSSQTWDPSKIILDRIFSDENPNYGESAEIDAGAFKTLLINKADNELLLTKDGLGWYDRSPISEQLCILAGVSEKNAYNTENSKNIKIKSIKCIKETDKMLNDYGSKSKEVCLSTTKIATDNNGNLIQEDGKYKVTTVDPDYPAYTVAYSVLKGGYYYIYIFSEDDEFDQYDEIDLTAKGSFKNLFRYFGEMTDVSSFFERLDTSHVTSYTDMFREVRSMKVVDISSFEFDDCTCTGTMFRETNIEEIIFGDVDLGNVTDLHQMFQNSKKLKTIHKKDGSEFEFNLASANFIRLMFNGCNALERITITGNNNTCTLCETDQVLDGNSTSPAAGQMLDGCTSLTDLTIKDIKFSRLTNLEFMLSYPAQLKNFTISNVTFGNSFTKLNKLSGKTNLESLTFDNVTFSNVTSFKELLKGDTNLKYVILQSLNVPEVNSFELMFNGCTKLKNITIESLNAPKLRTLKYTFQNCTSLESFDFSGIQSDDLFSLTGTFKGCTSLSSVTFGTEFNSSTATLQYLEETFSGCTSLKNINIYMDTTELKSSIKMFYGCNNLESVGFGERFTCNKVTTFESMFEGCSKLKTVNLSHFKTGSTQAVSTKNMFKDCAKLETIFAKNPDDIDSTEKCFCYLKNNSKSTISGGAGMFTGCTSLVGGNGTVYNANKLDATFAVVDTTDHPGYFTTAPDN